MSGRALTGVGPSRASSDTLRISTAVPPPPLMLAPWEYALGGGRSERSVPACEDERVRDAAADAGEKMPATVSRTPLVPAVLEPLADAV